MRQPMAALSHVMAPGVLRHRHGWGSYRGAWLSLETWSPNLIPSCLGAQNLWAGSQHYDLFIGLKTRLKNNVV